MTKMKKVMMAVAAAVGASLPAGQVRSVPAIHVEHGAAPKFAFSPCAARLAGHALRNGVAAGESLDASAFEGLDADVLLSWEGDVLHVALEPRGRAVKGEAMLSGAGGTVRVPIGGDAGQSADLPLTGAAADGGGLVFAVDLEWDGLDAAALRAMPADVRRWYIHTSLAAHTAAKNPEFRENPHLPRPDMWGRVKFGADCAAGARVVDGDLSDWPEAGFANTAILPELIGGRFEAAFQTAFDERFLYVAARLSNPSGGAPVNTAEAETGAGYGGGDALQIRISPDGKRSQSFCAWMSPTGPALTVDTKNPGERDLLKRGAEIAFGRGDGFTAVEIALPWKAVGARANEGDEWRVTYQPWWNAPCGRFAFFAPLVLEKPPAATVTAEVPVAGAVSLGVFDGAGRLVRTLLKAEDRAAGALSEPWASRTSAASSSRRANTS